MKPFTFTVPCSRPLVPAWADDFGNMIGSSRSAITFDAVFVPPATISGSQIVDGVLRETTITQPTLFIEGRPDIHSGDPIIVDGVDGWEVDGDPAVYLHPWTGWEAPLVVKLRKKVG